jgi:lipopolysaccharide transport system ATP-binding protein
MHRREIAKKFDAIVDFAGVEKFLDTPVKRYSSGMYVRLAFAVAAHLDTEILLLDEVLAVGDADFQAKCLGKVSELARSGRAVVLVSHNMATVRQFTTRAVLLGEGRLLANGPTDAVVEHYLDKGGAVVEEVDVSRVRRNNPGLGERARITKVRLNHSQGVVPGDGDLSYTVSVWSAENLGPVRVNQVVFSSDGHALGTSFTDAAIDLKQGCTSEVQIVLPNPALAPGHYYLCVAVGFGDATTSIYDLDVVVDTVHFEVASVLSSGGGVAKWDGYWGSMRFPTPRIEYVEITASGESSLQLPEDPMERPVSRMMKPS